MKRIELMNFTEQQLLKISGEMIKAKEIPETKVTLEKQSKNTAPKS